MEREILHQITSDTNADRGLGQNLLSEFAEDSKQNYLGRITNTLDTVWMGLWM